MNEDSWTIFCSNKVRKLLKNCRKSSLIVGWRFEKARIFVLASRIPAERAENAANVLKELLDQPAPEIMHILRNIIQPSILGYYKAEKSLKNSDETLFEFTVDHAGEISLKSEDMKTFTIYFDPPDPYYLESFETCPLILDTTVIDPDDSKRPGIPYAYPEKIRAQLHQHFHPSSTHSDLKFAEIVKCINCSLELDYLIGKKLGLRNWSFMKQLQQAVFALLSIMSFWSLKLFRWPINLLLMFARILAEVLLCIMNYSPVSGYSLVSISCFSQQVALRLEQYCHWPEQMELFQKEVWRYSRYNKAQYISFFNNIWLIANDIIVGMALGEALILNRYVISNYLEIIYKQYAVEYIQEIIVWLMGYPAGLKLNSNLTKFVGELFLWLISIWTSITDNIWPHMPIIIAIIGYAGIFGASMSLSMVNDAVSVMSVNFYMFYQTALRIYYGQLNALISLFYLFRGKKYNVLRQRMDSSDYEMDQLLLGTILLAILFFLFPTVSVYYLLFSLCRLAVVAIQIVLSSTLAWLNHFPLFALMLKFKDPQRLPAGIYMKLERSNVAQLKTKSISIRSIFFQYGILLDRLLQSHLTPTLILKILTGRQIPAVPYLEYPMIPAKRSSVNHYWALLKTSNKK